MTMKTNLTFLLIASLMSSAASISAAEPTALELIREGNRYVGEEEREMKPRG